MNKRILRLVYSRDNPEIGHAARAKTRWKLGDGSQLGLFDDSTPVRMYLVTVSNMNAHSFRRVLEENDPGMLLDTRKYPEFYSIYSSLHGAIEEFKLQGIKYAHVPIAALDDKPLPRSELRNFKEAVDTYLNRPTSSPIFLLAGTDYSMEKTVNRIGGFVERKISGVRLMELSG